MFSEIIEEKKVCLKRKIQYSILSVSIFDNIITLCHMDWCLKFVGFLRDIMEDDKNNDQKKKWRKGRENEYKCIVHKDKFKSNIWGSRKYKYIRGKK